MSKARASASRIWAVIAVILALVIGYSAGVAVGRRVPPFRMTLAADESIIFTEDNGSAVGCMGPGRRVVGRVEIVRGQWKCGLD